MNIQTERLQLRDYVTADWMQVHIYASDPAVCKFTVWGPNTEEDSRNYIELTQQWQQEQPRKEYELAVVLKETGQIIGGCGIHITGPAQADMGYCLAPEFWGKGYATEASRAILEFGFKELKLHRITATCHPNNTGSYKVLEKLGMTREGHLREHMWFKGQWRDSYLYAILEREWRG